MQHLRRAACNSNITRITRTPIQIFEANSFYPDEMLNILKYGLFFVDCVNDVPDRRDRHVFANNQCSWQ